MTKNDKRDEIPPSTWLPPQARRPTGEHRAIRTNGDSRWPSVFNPTTGGLVLVAMIVLTLVYTSVRSKPEKPAPASRPAHSAMDAWLFCRYAVNQKLRAPSTAKFEPAGQVRSTTHLGGGRYRVVSWVDAQNAFGAMIRTRFICEVDYPSKKLLGLTIQ